MDEERASEVLATYVDGLINHTGAVHQVDMTDEENARLTRLFQMAERLQQSMRPVQPSADFVHGLGKDLVDRARRRIRLTKRLRRAALIGAATLGSLLSIASVVGAILFLVARLRARAQARAIRAPTG